MTTDPFTAIAASDFNSLNLLLNQNININAKDKFGYSLLHYALIKNQDRIAELLVLKGADVNITDKIGQSPLHYCALMDKMELAKLLIAHKGDVSLSDIHDNQPLWTAVFNVKGKPERLDLVRLLLENNSDPNHKNKAGRSPLDFAKQVENNLLIEILEGNRK